ncbi:MAG: hypothetical protein H0T91_05580 [Propionibacteriaceae bacterium]|nr:hypothetical protein [Propionibacteriaceae bacterium]
MDYAGLTSATAPAVTSSAPGRIDLFTRGSAGNVVHTWFVNKVRQGQSDLGGRVMIATGSSVADTTLDVFGVTTSGTTYRKHFNGAQWSSWQPMGGAFTSAVGASANPSTKSTLITARGAAGEVFERTVTPSSNGAGWVRTPGTLWSARALGDARTGVGVVAVSSGSDQNAVVQRGSLVMAIRALYNSDPDVVTRPDGTWIMFGRSTNGELWFYDARSGGYANRSLGGIVR